MQKPNHKITERLSQKQFRAQAETQLDAIKRKLERLHGEPPCMYAATIETITSWTEARQDAELTLLRKNLAEATTIVEDAQRERDALWETAEADPEERILPSIVFFKQIREDLVAYEETLTFVRSKRSVGP